MSSTPLLGTPRASGGMSRSKSINTLVLERVGNSQKRAAALWLLTPLVIGVTLGLALPTSCQLPYPWNRVSQVIGWIYFAAWSVSFYPQLHLNYSRKSVSGLSLDFQLLNMLGFTCYAAYNAALFWNPVVRDEYARTHGGYDPAVHPNDVFFAIHAAVITAFTLFQCVIYDRGGNRPSLGTALATSGAVAGAAAYFVWVYATPRVAPHCLGQAEGCVEPGWLNWLSFLYTLSWIKMVVSLVKYLPQVYLNYRLKSTLGWNIWNVLLDLEGGLLSLAQLGMDSGITHDWTPVTGNPVKFALGFTSLFFDAIFLVQHYVLYRHSDAPAAGLLRHVASAQAAEDAALEDPEAVLTEGEHAAGKDDRRPLLAAHPHTR